MSSRDLALSVRGVSKTYTIFHNDEAHETLAGVVLDRLRNPFKRTNRETFWALRDLSFDVARGEVVGIIGRNGAGKSTLLKILSRITEPTAGQIDLYGRTGSLLEVGTGFHRELTGRENIYLNGGILGMSRADIDRRFDEIVEFSGIEQFLDTPVKRYSSGMYVRLAFAVAAHLEPEILIIDEVLAVGDVAFQQKCLGKMSEVAKEGRTVLFVSHQMEAVSTLTQRCLVLSHGRCAFDGPTPAAIARYHQLAKGDMAGRQIYTADPLPTHPRVTRVEVRTSEPHHVQLHGEPMEVEIEIATPRPLQEASASFQVVNHLGQPIIWLWTEDLDSATQREPGVFHLTCHIPRTHLYVGQYRLIVHFGERFGKESEEKIEEICPFEVVMYGRENDFGWRPGVCTYIEDCGWVVQKAHPDAVSIPSARAGVL